MGKRFTMLAVAGAAAGVVALVTACGAVSARTAAAPASPAASTASASPAASAASGKATCAPGGGPGTQSGPIDASFVSGRVGWLLTETFNDCTQVGTVAAYQTTDGGLTWAKIAAPAAEWSGGPGPAAPGSVSEVLFGNAKDGWAYGPGLWATHNGGASWHRVATYGYAVYSMAVTGASVVAAFDTCGTPAADCGNSTTFKVETAAVHTDTWQPIAGATGTGEPDLTARAGTAYAYGVVTSKPSPAAPLAKLGLLTGPANGSTRWHSEAIPCVYGAVTASAVTASSLLLGCAELGEHPATTHLYSSSDSGATWQQFATLGLYDGASVIEETPNGTLLVGGMYNGVELSHNGGRTWTRPAVDSSDPVGGGGSIAAALTTNADGYLIVAQSTLWITRDGGRAWTQVKAG